MIYIYGTSHLLQIKPPVTFGQDFQQLAVGKLHFMRDLADILACHPTIGLVAEETWPCWHSIAQEVALTGIRRYAEVNMPKPEGTRRGHPEHNAGLLVDMTVEENKRAGREREEYMVSRVSEWLPDVDSVLVVCGIYHLRGLKRMFERQGQEVIADGVVWRPWCRDEYAGDDMTRLPIICDPHRA